MIHTTLVSTELLQQNLADWAVIDCRFDLANDEWGREQYRAAHIPGAVYASLSGDVAASRTATSGRHPLPAVDALAATVGRLGVDNETQVVVYDQDSGMFASRVWWSLRYLGHDAVAALDGGFAKWTREQRSVESGDRSRPPRVFVARPRPSMVVSVDEVTTRLDDPGTLLVDARSPERFEGQSEPIDRVAGHIPGAINHSYRWNLDDAGTMRDAAELRERFSALFGGRAPGQVVAYCGSGVSACHNLLAMEVAGLPGTKLYVGSWSEWSMDPSRPVDRSIAAALVVAPARTFPPVP